MSRPYIDNAEKAERIIRAYESCSNCGNCYLNGSEYKCAYLYECAKKYLKLPADKQEHMYLD